MIATLKRDLDGIPYAVSVQRGLGLPYLPPAQCAYIVKLDGRRVAHVIGYDRKAGLVWSQTGRIVKDDWEVVTHCGEVTVEPID